MADYMLAQNSKIIANDSKQTLLKTRGGGFANMFEHGCASWALKFGFRYTYIGLHLPSIYIPILQKNKTKQKHKHTPNLCKLGALTAFIYNKNTLIAVHQNSRKRTPKGRHTCMTIPCQFDTPPTLKNTSV